MARVHLSAAGFYKTPKIHWDRAAGKGRPFYYYSYGAACSEVVVDTLTGEYRIERTDILHDVGKSLNPILDKGQVEGAFIQGMGWLTTEELWWDDAGRLRTHAPSTYKIPLASDRPGNSMSTWRTGLKTRNAPSSAPRPSANRPSCSASPFSKRCPWPLPASRITANARASMRRQRRNVS